MDTLSELKGTQWEGAAELWLDPLGDEVQCSDCTISVDAGVVRYTWSYKGEAHQGSLSLNDDGVDFTDTWHQPKPLKCRAVVDAWGLLSVQGTYGPDADWGWRIGLFLRAPTGQLVLQMTNIAPWGEEARAVRMICKRQS